MFYKFFWYVITKHVTIIESWYIPAEKKNRIASNRIMRHINKIALHILNKKMVQAGLRHTLEYILI